jgi:ABC-type sugar transport system substrate-binding protein
MLSAHTEYGIKERHSDVFREYLSTSANWDADKQALDIERLASAGLDLLLVEPLNSPLVASAVSRVQKLGLPVILVSGNLAGADYVSWVTTDEEERGRASASWLTRRVTGGRVIVLQSEPAQGDGQAWLEGVRDGLAAAPGLDIEYATSFWTVADSRRLVELALDRDPALAGLVVNHGTVAQGAVEALVERGLTIPPVAGADDNNGWLRTAREHRVSFLGFGGSSRLGLRSVELAVDVLSGNSVPVRCQQVQEVFDETAIEQLYRPELTDHYWANHELQETWIQAMFGRPG